MKNFDYQYYRPFFLQDEARVRYSVLPHQPGWPFVLSSQRVPWRLSTQRVTMRWCRECLDWLQGVVSVEGKGTFSGAISVLLQYAFDYLLELDQDGSGARVSTPEAPEQIGVYEVVLDAPAALDIRNALQWPFCNRKSSASGGRGRKFDQSFQLYVPLAILDFIDTEVDATRTDAVWALVSLAIGRLSQESRRLEGPAGS